MPISLGAQIGTIDTESLQGQKEVTLNEADHLLAQAFAKVLEVPLGAETSPLVLDDEEIRGAYVLKFTGAASAFEIQIPVDIVISGADPVDLEKPWVLWNASGQTLTVKTVGGSNSIVLPNTWLCPVQSDAAELYQIGQMFRGADTGGEQFVSGSYLGGTFGSSDRVFRYPPPIAVQTTVNLTGSIGNLRIAPTAQTDFDIQKNGVSVGTMRFAAGQNWATFIAAAAVSYTPGTDVLEIYAPASADATAADLSFSLKTQRI